MNDEFLRERARAVRTIAAKADPFIKNVFWTSLKSMSAA
jgi:hypothetical protein